MVVPNTLCPSSMARSRGVAGPLTRITSAHWAAETRTPRDGISSWRCTAVSAVTSADICRMISCRRATSASSAVTGIPSSSPVTGVSPCRSRP
jgi:hypothetical protein